MTVLITGASGFIGGALTRALAERGDRIRIFAREKSDLSHLEYPDCEVVRGALEQAETLEPAVKGVDTVYHCAALSTDWGTWKEFKAANITGVHNLLEAVIREGSIRRFVHISTTDVYGYPKVPCDETHPITDVGLPYNRTKGLGEKEVWKVYAETGLPVTVIRPATVYGPRSKDLVVVITELMQQKKMVLIDKGASRAGLLYIDNAVHGILQAAESEKTIGQAYNLRDGGDETWRDYIEALEKGLGTGKSWSNLPYVLAMATAYVSEGLYGLLRIRSRPLLTRHIVFLSAKDQAYSIEKARTDFGFKPLVSFEEGIARTVEWLRARENGA